MHNFASTKSPVTHSNTAESQRIDFSTPTHKTIQHQKQVVSKSKLSVHLPIDTRQPPHIVQKTSQKSSHYCCSHTGISTGFRRSAPGWNVKMDKRDRESSSFWQQSRLPVISSKAPVPHLLLAKRNCSDASDALSTKAYHRHELSW